MLKKTVSILLIIGVLLCAAPIGVFAGSDAPLILYVSKTAAGGDVINIYGTGFKPTSEVYTVILDSSGDRADKTDPGKSGLEIINISDDTIQCMLANDMRCGIYAVWVVNPESASSNIKYINSADASDISHKNAHTMQSVRIFGENMLNPSNMSSDGCRVILKCGDESADAVPYAVTSYYADFNVPNQLKEGKEYDVFYTNGVCISDCTSRLDSGKALTVTEKNINTEYISGRWGTDASWTAAINTGKIVNVKNFGAMGDGLTDDTEAISDALSSAYGGMLYIPAGTYLTEPFEITAGVIIFGDGKEKSVIKNKGGNHPSGVIMGFIDITSDNTAFADISLCSDIKRDDLKGYYMQGWYRVLSVRGTSGRDVNGFFMKNVRVTNSDGAGTRFYNVQNTDIDNCDINSTHTCVLIENKTNDNDTFRLKNSYIYNNQRVGFCAFRRGQIWLEGNTFEGKNAGYFKEPLWEDDEKTVRRWNNGAEHRIIESGGSYSYIADNTLKGDYGTRVPVEANDGEGILFQEGNADFTGSVSSAEKNSLTDAGRAFLQDEFSGRYVFIISGKGCGQVRKIISNTSDTLAVDNDWDIQPDSGSRYEIDSYYANRNIIVNNKFNVNSKKAGIFFYVKAVDNIVSGNTFTDSSGIFFNPSAVNTVYDGKTVHRTYMAYFNRVISNILVRNAAENSTMTDGGYRYSLGISNYGDAGYSYNRRPGEDVMLSMFQEYRDNSVTLLNAENMVEPANLFIKQFYDYFGAIGVSSAVNDGKIHSNGFIVQRNKLSGTPYGVYMGCSAKNTVITDCEFSNNSKEAVSFSENNVNTKVFGNKTNNSHNLYEGGRYINVTYNGTIGRLKLNGKAGKEYSGKSVCIMVYNSAADISDVENYLYFTDFTETDADGGYSFNVNLSQLDSASAYIKIKCDGLETECIKINEYDIGLDYAAHITLNDNRDVKGAEFTVKAEEADPSVLMNEDTAAIAAYYKNGSLLNCDIRKLVDGELFYDSPSGMPYFCRTVNYTLDADALTSADTIKLMIWDGLLNLIPVVEFKN